MVIPVLYTHDMHARVSEIFVVTTVEFPNRTLHERQPASFFIAMYMKDKVSFAYFGGPASCKACTLLGSGVGP